MAMTDQQKQDIKEYLKENLTITNEITPDLYGNNPDQIDLTVLLEGEVVATTRLYPLDSY
jgi:hypothetical protein